MTLAARMTHRCTIQRGTPATYDTPGSWAAHLTNVPCAYLETATDERTDDGGTRLVRRATLLLPLGTDVRASDRVTSLVNGAGMALLSGAAAIDGDPIRYPGHVAVLLAEVR